MSTRAEAGSVSGSVEGVTCDLAGHWHLAGWPADPVLEWTAQARRRWTSGTRKLERVKFSAAFNGFSLPVAFSLESPVLLGILGTSAVFWPRRP